VHQLRVTLSSAERHMHACLAAFERAVQREEGGRAADVCLALTVRLGRSTGWLIGSAPFYAASPGAATTRSS
jgi:hypothetical protein